MFVKDASTFAAWKYWWSGAGAASTKTSSLMAEGDSLNEKEEGNIKLKKVESYVQIYFSLEDFGCCYHNTCFAITFLWNELTSLV